MPRKPMRPCRFPGCTALCDGPYCNKHKPTANFEYNHYRRDAETNKRYGTEWKRIRKMYVKTHPLCETCLQKGLLHPVEEVHHIVPLADGGTNDFSNLMSLCKSCHSAITLAATKQKRKYENK